MDLFKPHENIPKDIYQIGLRTMQIWSNQGMEDKILAAMMYAVEMSREDSAFYDKLKTRTDYAFKIQNTLEFIKIIVAHSKIPGLVESEKEELSKEYVDGKYEIDDIYNYLIERTTKIGGFDANIINLQNMVKWKISPDIIDQIYDFETAFIQFMTNHPIFVKLDSCKEHFSEMKKATFKDVFVNLQKSMINNEYISIDMKSGNFTIIFYYIGHFLLGLPIDYLEYNDLVTTLTTNPFLIGSKELRGTSFGKLFRILNFQRDFEKIMFWITGLIGKLVEKHGAKIVVYNLDEIVIKKDKFTVDEVKSWLPELAPQIGDVMTGRFKVEEFYLKQKDGSSSVVLEKSTGKVMFMTPQIAYSIFEKN